MSKDEPSGRNVSNVGLGNHAAGEQANYQVVSDQQVHIRAHDGGTVNIITVRSNENLLETFPGLVLISVFLEDAADAEVIEDAVRAAAEQLGLDIVADSPPILGSWFKRMLARGRAEFTEERIRATIEGAVRAVELEQVEKRQAQVNATNIGAVAELIEKLNDTPAAVVQIGSLILIKEPETLVVRELTPLEQATLRDNPILLKNAQAAAAVLNSGQRGSTNVTIEQPPAAPQIAG
ncbi:hypothetical protein HII36_05140 [Nonomuraea sp. NN258]|uniref:hypothetical protein n=1 Tax=Nonomuraea antri TaxID=2730852 RepID=UPI001568598D|nr:hypothetical protein [Nonomuraea antri]NRQ31221.1 hypothetical protein [Nonomuraea antri]